jgi:hypothetical protein
VKPETVARFGAAALLAVWPAACGSGGGDGNQDAAPTVDGAAPPDAWGDAAVVDCSADYRESNEGKNDPFSPDEGGSAERTELALAAGGAGFTICGQIDPAQASELVSDYDAYLFDVSGGDPVNLRIELRAPGAAGSAPLGLDVYRVQDGLPVPLAAGPFRNGYAIVAGVVVQPGSYWVSAVGWPPAPDAPVGYAISVDENPLRCPRADGNLDYLESNDGAGRGNDTVAIHRPEPPALTSDTSDQPEATALSLEPDAVALLRGVSAAIESTGDSYLDRDTYLLETGPNTSELELRLSWDAPDADLDLYLFAAGDPATEYSVGLGTSPGSSDELMTLNVDPDRRYWLWIGAYAHPGDQPLPYDVTLCPRTHAPSPSAR